LCCGASLFCGITFAATKRTTTVQIDQVIFIVLSIAYVGGLLAVVCAAFAAGMFLAKLVVELLREFLPW
jgi:hypothetical protein